MKTVEIEFADDIYGVFQEQAERQEATVAEIVLQKIGRRVEDASRPWRLTPLNMGIPKIPVLEWRLAANERPDDE